MVTNAELQQQVVELRELVGQLRQASPAPSGTLSSGPAPPRKEPKLPEPPEFDGKPSEYATFVNHCDLYFRMRPITFDGDYVKVAYVISRCRGTPAEWGHSLLESSSDLLHDYSAFKAQMASMYADKQRRKALRRKLATLKQTGSASKFASEFLTIANILDVDEESRFALFTNGLKPEVQRALAIARDADTFEELVNSAVQIDHVNYTLAKASQSESKSSGKSGSGKGNAPPSSRPQQPRNDSNPSSSSPPPNNSRTSSSKNASGSHGPISQEEKDRREALGLCRFCGGNHFKRDCPVLKAKEAKKGSSRYPTPAPTLNVNSDSAPSVPPVTVSHIISSAGKYDSQSQ
jgi:hypothetical protein